MSMLTALSEKDTIASDSCPVCSTAVYAEWLSAPDRFNGRTQPYELVRCSGCSLVWLKDPPQPELMQDHYGRNYDDIVADAGDSPERWTWRRDVLQKHKSGGAVLDIGCNAGGFLEVMSGSGWTVSGIEMSEAMARRAVERSGAKVFVGDVLSAPFEPESFDAVTCFHVLEHVYQPQQVLERIQGWLKPGGILYLMVPNINSAGARIFGSYWSALELPRHLYHFSPKSLRILTQSAGFHEVSLRTHREMFLESSLRYCFDGMLRKVGIPRQRPARRQKPFLPWRVVRKGLRLTVFPAVMVLTSLAGEGETIHAIFRKSDLNPAI